MSNNISRKGLALGALIAIGASLFAGAPAHAAAGVTLAPKLGTSYNSVVGASFDLVPTASSEIPSSSYSTWAVSVENLNGSTGHVYFSNAASADIRATDASKVIALGTNVNNPTVTLTSTGDTTTASFKVTAWLDANANGAVDPTEYSAVQTVKFLGAADLTATTTLTKVPALDTDANASVQARVVIDGVNTNYVGSPLISFDVRLNNSWDVRNSSWTSLVGHNGIAVTQSTDVRQFDTAVVNAGDATISARLHTAGTVVSAQAYLGSAKLGAAASATVGAASVTGIAGASVAGSNADASTFRKNSTFQVKFTATGATRAAVAGRTLAVTPSSNFNVDGASVAVNGTTYTTSTSFRAATINVVTDADGVATLNVTTAGWGSDAISFSAKADNATSNTVSLSAATINYTAAASVATGAIVVGGTFQVGVTLKDQFGVGAASGYTAQAQYVSGVGSSASNSYTGIVNGAATLNITSDSTSTGNVRYTIIVRQNDTVNGGYTGAPIYVTNPVDLKIRVAQELVSYAITGVTSSTRANLANSALTVANGASVTNWNEVTGTVSSSTAVRPYATVTFTAAGALLHDAINDVYAVGTITFVTDANGYYDVDVASNTTGLLNWTATSGAVSATGNVGFNAPANSAGTQFVVDAPVAVALVGTANAFTLSVRDVYGNMLTGNPSLSVRGDDATANVAASNAGYLVTSATKSVATTVNYVVAYYNGTSTITQEVRLGWAAAVVTVTLGDTVVAGQNSDVIVSVQDPAGNGLAGKTVTATSSGVGYLTVASGVTDANGQATLKLLANEGELGWAYVTASVTVNSVSSSSDATGVQVVAADVAPSATDSVAAIALEAAATAQAGTVVDVVATATDADGNPVSGATVSAVSTGVGYLAIAGGTTDENGQVVLKLVLSAGQAGDASVVASAGSAQSDAAVVTAGLTDANITLAKKRVTIDWSFAAGKKVVITRDGVKIKSFTASSNAADSYSFNLKKGTHKVSVKVGGVTLDSATYKIK